MQNKAKKTSMEQRRPFPYDMLAAGTGVIVLYLGMIIFMISRNGPVSNSGYIFYLAVISPLTILIILLLQRFVSNGQYRDLNLKEGSLPSDLLAVLILGMVLFAANITIQPLLSELLPDTDTGVRDLFLEMSGDPVRFILFLGPLVMLGAASEELMRAFLLSCLWKVWPSMPGKLAVIFLSACLFGLLHLSRGMVHMVSATIIGLIMAFYYLRFGRILPLILGHYITNAVQVVISILILS
jgi:membrane protease YdiL (CAAX protease family)